MAAGMEFFELFQCIERNALGISTPRHLLSFFGRRFTFLLIGAPMFFSLPFGTLSRIPHFAHLTARSESNRERPEIPHLPSLFLSRPRKTGPHLTFVLDDVYKDINVEHLVQAFDRVIPPQCQVQLRYMIDSTNWALNSLFLKREEDVFIDRIAQWESDIANRRSRDGQAV
jgi:hypothetical protein